MGSSLKRRSATSAVLALLMAVGAVTAFGLTAWAGRERQNDDLRLAEFAGDVEFAKRHQKPTAHMPPAGRSPLGDLQPATTIAAEDADSAFDTPLGPVHPRRMGDLRRQAPALAGSEGQRLARGHGEIAEGFNAVQISRDVLRVRTMDEVIADLERRGVRVHDVMANDSLLVEVPRGGRAALAGSNEVRAALPWDALFRVDPALGRGPSVRRTRATGDDIDLIVTFFRHTDMEKGKRELEAAAGAAAVPFGIDELSLQTKAHFSKVAHIARLDRVRYVRQVPEFMLFGVETPTTAMVGNVKENLPFQKPYHDAGVDGGGLDTNADGQRINNGTDAVPPQIVAVTDNGLSIDSIQFSQTATQVTDLVHPLGPAHRKVHAVQDAGDTGSTCDSTLSGGGTHGNVVAGLIAGDGTSLGARVSKHTYNIRPAVHNLEMSGVARGARILMQDAAAPNVCTLNDLMERGGNVSPLPLADRLSRAICPRSGGVGACAGVVGGGEEVHLHVMPFGTPNFDLNINNPTDGTYTTEAREIDTFLVNNRDYMVFVPVGNQGTATPQRFFSSFANEVKNKYPDLFDGTASDNDPNFISPLQLSPPATAKNIVSVGSHFQDVQTAFAINEEENISNFSSKGPATALSLRTAPMIMGVGGDGTGFFFTPNTVSAAVYKSSDNDNTAPVESELDDINFGTSYASAEITGVAALIRDYFAQGFYPTGGRVDGDRIPNVSGPLVKAAIAASANFLEQIFNDYPTLTDREVASARSINLGTVAGTTVGIIGNSEQGYGRPVVTSVLPLANWPTGKGIGAPDTVEYPSAGLLVYDEIATGEPAINNTTRLAITHDFTVAGESTRLVGPTRIVDRGQLRIALAWSDPPSGTGTAGLLVNDLDLELESPGADNDIATSGDNVIYDGNLYQRGTLEQGQWSQGRLSTGADLGDRRNPVEAIHLSADPNGDGNPADSQLVTGTWRVRVERGLGGATAGQITVLTGGAVDPVEDDNGNGRLDPGEDDDGDGFLDADGQPYGLVIAGPVFGIGTQTFGGSVHTLPDSVARLDKSLYGCADDVTPTILSPATNAAAVGAATSLEVVTRTGVVVDAERNFVFSTAAGSNVYVGTSIPVREGRPSVRHNGILETNGLPAEEPYSVRLVYSDTPREARAAARVSCSPGLLAWRFLLENENYTQQVAIGGGCDRDQFMDSGETVTYSVTFANANLDHHYTDVSASLAVTGAGANAVRILNSPINIGRIPGGQISAANFALRIDGPALAAIPVASRIVDMTLTLQAASGNALLPRQTFTFKHALNSDYEAFHYSTDHPGGGVREIRDFNRNLQIDRPDVTDPFVGIVLPDEDLTFSSMFVAGTSTGLVTNTLGEDLDNDGIRDPNEPDTIPDNVLNRGILALPGGPSANDLAPFNFDAGGGGFIAFRSPFSRPGAAPAQTWEHVRTGVCGFQTAIADSDVSPGFQNLGAGIWHTGDGNPTTPGASACDSHLLAADGGTPIATEFVHDFLVSPIIAKVHQTLDSRGLPYSAEFQRVGFNVSMQTEDDLSGLNWNVDNNAEDDTGNCLLCQEFDFTYGGIDYQVGTFKNSGVGSDPTNLGVPQRTFGPLRDPDGSVTAAGKTVTGDEIGFSGFTLNTNPDSSSPIPTAAPNLLPYPILRTGDAGAPPTVLASDGTPWTNNAAGPVRNIDFQLINYEGGFISPVEGPGGPTSAISPFTVNVGFRWQIGFGFFTVEGAVPDYGYGIDDVVFEWDERHPVDESVFSPAHTPACQRFGQPGQAAGQQCATLSVERGVLYECDETVTVTVNDQKRIGAGSVQVLAASDSDARLFSTGSATALHPTKTFSLPETAPGIFTGNVALTQTVNNASQLLVGTGDSNVQFYYLDPLCDGSGDGIPAQNDFNNLDGDGVAFASDNCPFVHNPGQEDFDADGLGDVCDNCPRAANNALPTPQADSDGDRVGDACDLDDIDFDGVVNQIDNCPDVYNPFQTPGGPSGNGLACDATSDRDGDGTNDRNDNCVRTPNSTQTDRDSDGVGDACDGDCLNARAETLATGSCNRTSQTQCTTDAQCPSSGTCSSDPNRVCTADSQQCGTCLNISPETCFRAGVVNDGSCSLAGDDLDVDGVSDALDNCPQASNPAIIPGTNRQADADNDGLGDACDSAQMIDGNNNGIPDDAVSFGLLVNCGRVPLPGLVIEASMVTDVNGDLDAFCDTGEKCEMTLILTNAGPMDLTEVTLHLASQDDDIACVTKPSIAVGNLAAGTRIDTSNLGGQRRPFEFTASASTETTSASNPEKGDFTLNLTSRQALGTRSKVAFQILMDLDLPVGVTPVKVPTPDGPGILVERFDIDRNGVNGVELSDGRDQVPNDTFGYTVSTALGGLNQLQGIGCAGFNVPPKDPQCIIEVDNDMGWHIHCPSGECPPPAVVGSDTSFARTPPGGEMSFSGRNSLHWGRHMEAASRAGDTSSFREMAAYTTNPINLTPLPVGGDLELSFFHIADMMDNNEASLLGIPPFQSVDHGDVHIRVDLNGDPAIDDWGFWDKLAPFQNVYDHVPYIWSFWGARVTYCTTTPTDTGAAAPAPRGVHETMCMPQGVWSHCGNAYGTAHTYECDGPGVPGVLAPASGALWVQTKFSLANFLGARVQIRWIAQGWEFDPFGGAAQSYHDYGRGWEGGVHDDGWWVDDIRVTGAITQQASTLADSGPTPPSTCPVVTAGACPTCCDETQGDRGFAVSLAVRDGGNGDGIFERGETIEIDAAGTTNGGGCANGVPQYRFLKNGQIAQDFSANAFFTDGANVDATYQVQVRCSTDSTCTTVTGASQVVRVYQGDGSEVQLSVTHDRLSGVTTLRWPARPAPVPMTGYDLFRGTVPPVDASLATLVSLACDIGGATPIGTDVTSTTAVSPAVGQAHYYLAGHSSPVSGARTALGRHTNGNVRIAPIACP